MSKFAEGLISKKKGQLWNEKYNNRGFLIKRDDSKLRYSSIDGRFLQDVARSGQVFGIKI